MAKLRQVVDTLWNAMTGQGTGRDQREHGRYAPRVPLSQADIHAAYGTGLMRKIVNIPPLDMVREWRTYIGEAEDVAKIETEEKRLHLRQKVRTAEVLRRLGGGAMILGLPGNPATPAPDRIRPGELEFIHVVSRWALSFSRTETDARKPGYGEPLLWQMPQAFAESVFLHPSRVITFRGDCAAESVLPQQDGFWGESVVAHVLDAVADSDTARASFAALLHKARLTRVGIPGLVDMIASGEEAVVQRRIEALRIAESIHNISVFDAGDVEGKGGESIADVAYDFAGARDMLLAFAEFVCAISDIPATRLLGRAPEGLNSSGDSQQADWNKRIMAMQELELGPCLDRLDPYLYQSALGVPPAEDNWYEWAPLDMPSQKEVAERFKTQMEAVSILVNTATIPDRPLARGVQSMMIEAGYLPELEAALAELPEEVRWGLEQTAEDLEAEKEAAAAGMQALAQEPEPFRQAANDASEAAPPA